MTDLPPAEIIETARALKNVDPGWPYAMCSNACGELVFYPPEGAGAIIVCSATCAHDYLEKIKERARHPGA